MLDSARTIDLPESESGGPMAMLLPVDVPRTERDADSGITGGRTTDFPWGVTLSVAALVMLAIAAVAFL